VGVRIHGYRAPPLPVCARVRLGEWTGGILSCVEVRHETLADADPCDDPIVETNEKTQSTERKR
jgi:hypothetical protein